MDERTRAIQKAEKSLEAATKQYQAEYFESVWRAIGGSVAIGADGIESVASNTVFLNAWKRIVGRGVNSSIKEHLKDLQELQAKFYKKNEKPMLPFSQIKKIVEGDLLRNVESFAKAYNDSTVVASAVRQASVGFISSGMSYSDVRAALYEYTNGNKNKLGAVENYNFVQIRIQDTFAEYDRRLSNEYANQLGLNYFIYQGGEITTTREFCEERAAKVYTREEGIAFDALEWEGKKPNNVFFNDCGGYNCRHFLDWISYELAVQLRPDIKKSVFDV